MQPMLDRLPAFGHVLGALQALRGDRDHDCKRVLYAVVQLFQDQTLQSFRDLLICRFQSGLCQKAAEVHVFDLKSKFIFRSHDTSRTSTVSVVRLPPSGSLSASVGWAKARSVAPTRSFTEADQQIPVAVGDRRRVEKRSTFDLEPPMAGQRSFPKRIGGHGALPVLSS